MRIDKYLWCVRYFKTRSLATEACNKGHLKINNAVVKASKDVFIGDAVTIRKNQIYYSFEVIGIPTTRVGAKLVALYIIDTTPAEELERLELVKYSQDYYRGKGTGRPTKKDRRDLEEFTDEND
ncbi:MAG TPA: RNA-binding S4 domain-containing protein [Flavobacteriaceae bacterium]|nr:RNA-binding S4 domain-containing protein [Flavobacteriaceae bacterium]